MIAIAHQKLGLCPRRTPHGARDPRHGPDDPRHRSAQQRLRPSSKLMDEHSVIALPAGTTVLRLLPPLIVSEEEIDLAVNAIASVIPE
ncbi:MAG: hypothetical protein R2856_30850 [Caldilineaceae bacterium]